MGASETQRTMDWYRKAGYDVAKLEYYLHIPGREHGVRRDAYGFIDILVFDGQFTLAIQATSTSNMGARIKKILALPVAKRWLSTGSNRLIHVIGWKKYVKPINGYWWRPTVTPITLGGFNEQT